MPAACSAASRPDRTLSSIVAVKPTSSIRLARHTIDTAGNAAMIETHGRHDPCVGIRATPICEAMLALTLMDHALRHRAQNADVNTGTPVIAAQAPQSVIDQLRAAAGCGKSGSGRGLNDL